MNHFYESIQGWFNYQQIYNAAVAAAPQNAHFVELGSWRGRSTAYLAVEIINSGKNIRLDAVDTWLGSNEQAHVTDPGVVNGTLYQEFLANMEPVRAVVTPVRATSREAVSGYQDNSLDMVLIDGSHEYQEVVHDITAWLAKVKPGSMLAGDDYEWPGVKQAVNELLPNATIIHGPGLWVYEKPLTTE